jgi:BioD-like phosphotransacetylase family protein
MPALVLFSQRPRVGKTAVAVGLAQRLRQAGRPAALIRLGLPDDESAAADARCFASFGLATGKATQPLSADEAAGVVQGAADTTFVLELPAGETARPGGGAAVLVERFADVDAAKVTSLGKTLGASFAGVIVTATPAPRLAAASEGLASQDIPLLAALPQDRLLAAPTIAEMAAALDAEALFLDGRADTIVERMTIASIAADPGQGYFARFGPQAVIVRCDKPDLQLAALHTSTLCLVLTGGRMPLGYVTERAESEGVPVLITAKDTPAAVRALEGLYAGRRFGGRPKAERIAHLMTEQLDNDALRKVLTSGQTR